MADGKQRACREGAQRKNQNTAGMSKRGWEQAAEEGAGSLQGAEMGQSEETPGEKKVLGEATGEIITCSLVKKKIMAWSGLGCSSIDVCL